MQKMEGIRLVGKRKYELLVKIQHIISFYAKNGVNATQYICKKYKLKSIKQLSNINTKRLSGVISDIKEMSL